MKSRIFEESFQSEVLTNFTTQYFELLQDLREDVGAGEEFPFGSEQFQGLFADCLMNKNLDSFDGLNFYWLYHVDQLIYLGQLHTEIEQAKSAHVIPDEELEEEIFNFWNDSEYAGVFLDLLEKSPSVEDASAELFPVLENQITSFFMLHICGELDLDGHGLSYHFVPELGEKAGMVYLGKGFNSVKVKSTADDLLYVRSVDHNEKVLVTEENKKLVEKKSVESKKIVRDGYSLNFLPTYSMNKDELIGKINHALDLIESSSTVCYGLFKKFSTAIVPINEKGIVSYSMQSLPGFSSINTADRDFVDLMDDLIHENGHHYMNAILNAEELINEDDEKIYYSPWRRSLRPIRGIYHAVFTFYWATQLFSDLYGNIEALQEHLSESELDKIRRRFAEEQVMIDFCSPLLVDARDNGKVTDEGQKLIEEILTANKSLGDLAKKAASEIKSEDQQEKLTELKDHLAQMSKKYKL
jgi:hypothetical protein